MLVNKNKSIRKLLHCAELARRLLHPSPESPSPHPARGALHIDQLSPHAIAQTLLPRLALNISEFRTPRASKRAPPQHESSCVFYPSRARPRPRTRATSNRLLVQVLGVGGSGSNVSVTGSLWLVTHSRQGGGGRRGRSRGCKGSEFAQKQAQAEGTAGAGRALTL